MAQMISYVVGVLVAGLIVFGLYFGMYLGSPAYARQVNAAEASEMSLDELEENLREGTRTKQIAAITAIGQGDDQMDRRVALIAAATASTDRSIQVDLRFVNSEDG